MPKSSLQQAILAAPFLAVTLAVSAPIAFADQPSASLSSGEPLAESGPIAAGLPCLPSDWRQMEADGADAQATPEKVSASQAVPPQSPTQSMPATVTKGGKSYRVMHWEFQNAKYCNAFNAEGVYFLTRFDRFADAMFSPSDPKTLAALKKVSGLRWAEVAEASITPPPVIQPEAALSRGTPEEVVRGGYGGLTGRGVIVAILDTGIDFHHPDFITYDAAGRPTSRVRYLWDTLHDFSPGDTIGSPAPVSFPDRSSIGTIYSRDELTADLRAAKPQIPPIDLNGHGTACAGIAVGNGNALRKEYAGVAPGADLVIVRVGDASKRMVTEYLGGAIFDWLEKIAGSTPMVVSCSFGGFNCGHDGFTIFERQVDVRFSLDRPGRAIVVAAGNNGTLPMHATLSFKGVEVPAQLNWTCKSPTQLQIYVSASKPTDFEIRLGSGTKLTHGSAVLNALSGQVVIVESVPAGKGSLTLASKSGRACQADAYLLDSAAKFLGKNEVIERMVDTPGCSANAITVGSYNWNNLVNLKGKTVSLRDSGATNRSITIGELSAYSTPGYWRFGSAVKPEITAPGQWWMAPAPQNLHSVDSMRDGSGRYRVFNGTSAATPYVAGIVALMMEKNPKQSLRQIRQALVKCVGNDEFTGTVPNIHWGYGKLDCDAVERLLAGKYTVWVYKLSSARWIKQDDRMLSTDDAAQAKSYAATVNQTQGWKATTNLPAD